MHILSKETLLLLRIIGALFGLGCVVWAFSGFRIHRILRGDFLWTVFLGSTLTLVAVYPDTINIIAGMLRLDNREYGRLIVLLILSNFLLWALALSARRKDAKRSRQFDLFVRHLVTSHVDAQEIDDKVREITVIIPALNEAENLKNLLPRMPKVVQGHSCGVLIVDDGSSDDTRGVASGFGCLVASLPVNRGGGAALRIGFDLIKNTSSSIVVTMDGDGQHRPEEIENLVAPILNDQADIVIGSRVLGQREPDSLVRWLGIHIFSWTINLLAGTRITDCSNGFRAFRVDSLNRLMLVQDQFHTAELIIDAARKRFRITEAPITVLRRQVGKSKKGENLGYGLNFLKVILKTWMRK